MMTTIEKLQEAVKHLARKCDYAETKDGEGFSRYDAEFGHSLASQKYWTKRQAEAAQKMLKKYHNQLKAAGFDVEELFGEIQVINRPTKTKTKIAKLVNPNTIQIRFTFDWNTLQVVKSIPGRRFHNDGKYWTCPVTPEALRILEQNGFEIDEQIKRIVHRKTVTIDDISLTLPPLKLKRTLFPFQEKGVAFMEVKKGRAILGDEMGLGKTIQSIAWFALHPEKRPVIIVCPAHMKLKWAREIQETIPGEQKIEVLFGTTPHSFPAKTDFIVINYDILTYWVDTLLETNPQGLIVDEAHYCKNTKAKRSKATRRLAQKIPHVLALTGTPIVNRPVEGYNIIQMVDPQLFPNWWEYVHKYCDAKQTPFGLDVSGASNQEELHQKLKSVMIRRKKKEVLLDLPEKMYSYIPLEINNKNEYTLAENDFIAYLLNKEANIEKIEKTRKAEHLVKVEALKQLAVKGKIDQAIDWIKNFLNTNGQKLVVFAVHKEVVNRLMKEFEGVAVKIDGSVTAEKREEAVKAFQNNPNTKLFVGNIQAAGTGIDLTAASSVAFLELPWTPGELQQAEDRCHRIGQKDSVNVYYLLAEGTIEEKIARLLDSKRRVLDKVLDGEETNEDSLISQLIESYKNKEEEK